MTSPRSLRFRRQPSTLAFMLRALGPRRPRAPGVPPVLEATWSGHRADVRVLAELSGRPSPEAPDPLPLLYPHVVGFPLHMAVLTHPAFGVPIWRILQTRDHVVGLRPIRAGAILDFATTVAAERVLEKGLEVDLHTTVHQDGDLAWESLVTFHCRGRFGEAGPASRLALAPVAGGPVVAEWRTPSGGGWRFGRLSGDLNGIHWWNAYARAFGYRRTLHHPQVVLGQCVERLPAAGSGGAQRLDAWLKGPVYTGSDVRMTAREEPGGTSFALFAGEERPAIVGRWGTAPEGSRLMTDEADSPRPSGGRSRR